jgi:uncharacterized membrane protein HdeD (DUF308 family)
MTGSHVPQSQASKDRETLGYLTFVLGVVLLIISVPHVGAWTGSVYDFTAILGALLYVGGLCTAFAAINEVVPSQPECPIISMTKANERLVITGDVMFVLGVVLLIVSIPHVGAWTGSVYDFTAFLGVLLYVVGLLTAFTAFSVSASS